MTTAAAHPGLHHQLVAAADPTAQRATAGQQRAERPPGSSARSPTRAGAAGARPPARSDPSRSLPRARSDRQYARSLSSERASERFDLVSRRASALARTGKGAVKWFICVLLSERTRAPLLFANLLAHNLPFPRADVLLLPAQLSFVLGPAVRGPGWGGRSQPQRRHTGIGVGRVTVARGCASGGGGRGPTPRAHTDWPPEPLQASLPHSTAGA